MLGTSLAFLLAASPSAEAGGLGLMGTGGYHGDRVYYYTQNAIGEYEQQAPIDEMNPDLGGGLEVIIGDKDYKINGLFRFYYMQDAPVVTPNAYLGTDAEYTYNIRSRAWRPIGVVDAGLSFGLFGDPSGFQMVAVALVGSGFMTSDMTEFVMARGGVGATYTMARHVQFHLEVDGGARYRKRLYPVVNGSAGVRYLFD